MKRNAFQDQSVIVTGASAGIGKALALQLASQGASIAIAARRAERLEKIAEECRQRGGKILVVQTDVADEEQCRVLVEKTINAFGRLDMLINNAGLAVGALFEQHQGLNLFRHTLNVNFYGAIYCTYYALPFLKQTKGRIIAISSLGGKIAIPYNTPYCSSKYALQGFYDALRLELYQQGVSATVICPWWVITEFHEAQLDKQGVPVGPRGRAIYSNRMMTADRCAEITLLAAYKRRREVLMWPGPLAVWLKVLAPDFLDWIAVKVFLESIIRRSRSAQSIKA